MTSVRTVLVGLTAASLFALPAVASAHAPTAGSDKASQQSAASSSSERAAGKYRTWIEFLPSDHTRGFGSKTVVKGQIAYKPGNNVGAVPGPKKVKLLRKAAGASRWVSLGKDTTDKDTGIFAFKVRSKSNASYRVKYAGNAKLKPGKGTTSVSVYRTFGARVEDGSGRFHGQVAPRNQLRIYLEKRNCADCGWHSVKSDTTSRRGGYSFKIGAPAHGRWWWRVTTPATRSFIKSYSSVFTTERG